MAPATRIRPYKDFLTPAMHKGFATATGALFVLCYLESLAIGRWNSFFWSWFPFGRAGIRAGLLFIPAFMIFFLRVAQLHVGIRTSSSGWETFRTYAFGFHVFQTIGWYCLSAYLFSEIYIWSASESADLNRIKTNPKVNRPMLNEKPIYYTSFIFFMALVQAGFHLFYDYDRLNIPITKTKPIGSADQRAHLVIPPRALLKANLVSIVISCLRRVILVALVSPFLYVMSWGIFPFSIRSAAYSFTLWWAKIFWNLPKSGALPTIYPFHYEVILRTISSGFLLLLLWEFGNAAFSAYIAAQEPLKNGRPITYESRDPNGSLLTGLRGQKLQTRAFAFWELVYIAQGFEGRRKMIFEDIDRVGGSMWSQVRDVCLDVVNGIGGRITEYLDPNPPVDEKDPARPKPEPLPRIAQPLKDGLANSGDLFTAGPPPKGERQRAAEAVAGFAKRHGQSPPNDRIVAKSKIMLLKAEGAMLSKQQKQTLSSEGVTGLFKENIVRALQKSFGWPFRQEYRRRLNAIVLGSPYGDVGIIVDAVDSLTRFAVCSLKEDKYGNVQKDIKSIILSFTKVILELEGFRTSIGFHWTDVERKQESPEIDTVLAALKGGLSALVDAFETYAADLKISAADMREARTAATVVKKRAPEMTQS
ncbi:nuclear envelope protein [Amylocarpus encephaloides]|uniref:Nuclear envelope protein n=1 Tax=Amylocarpus encephaloides TaxID=45428 RepID=A0A9P7YQK8_9HELO|nr:nuclear envelope protein [Amylocarpus encephaloides]